MITRQLPWRGPTLAAGFAWTLLAASGCSSGVDYSILKLSEVTGVVTLDGEPLPGATVRFYTPDGLTYSYGVTDAAGAYRLNFDSVQSGIQRGDKIVRITTLAAAAGDDDFEAAASAPGSTAATERLPARYHQNSELKVTVDQPRQTFNFDLHSGR